MVCPLECPFVAGGNSITSDPAPSRFALSRSPSGKNTTLASLGTSISPIERKAFRANSSELRQLSPKLRSLIIFFKTAVHAAFLSSGLFHFLMILGFLWLGSLLAWFYFGLFFATLLLSAL